MLRTLIVLLSLFFSLHAFASSVCASISDTSCASYPEQAQIIAQVTDAEVTTVDGESVCAVTVQPRYFSSHALCPLSSEETLRYVVCGACPEIGAEVSGVLMKDASGIMRLD